MIRSVWQNKQYLPGVDLINRFAPLCPNFMPYAKLLHHKKPSQKFGVGQKSWAQGTKRFMKLTPIYFLFSCNKNIPQRFEEEFFLIYGPGQNLKYKLVNFVYGTAVKGTSIIFLRQEQHFWMVIANPDLSEFKILPFIESIRQLLKFTKLNKGLVVFSTFLKHRATGRSH